MRWIFDTYQARKQAGGYDAFLDSVKCSIASNALSLVLDRPLSKRILQAHMCCTLTPLHPCPAKGLDVFSGGELAAWQTSMVRLFDTLHWGNVLDASQMEAKREHRPSLQVFDMQVQMHRWS